MTKNGYKQCPTRGTIYIMLQKQAIFKFVTLSHCATVSRHGSRSENLVLTYTRRAGAENQQVTRIHFGIFHFCHLC